MIKGILVINNHGQARLVRLFTKLEEKHEDVIREVFNAVSKRPDTVCNFLEEQKVWGSDVRLIYRHYATLYFVFAVDDTESELGILDLIQVFVEALDKCFENVCELDLIFHADKVQYILDELVMGGMVLETNLNEILKSVNGALKHEKNTEDLALQRRSSLVMGAPGGPKK